MSRFSLRFQEFQEKYVDIAGCRVSDVEINGEFNKTKKEGDEEVNIQNREERTTKRLQQIGNSIHRSIRVTVDFSSKHENGRMPILDTEQWIDNVQVGDLIKPQILHSHYSKPMASKYACLKDSVRCRIKTR